MKKTISIILLSLFMLVSNAFALYEKDGWYLTTFLGASTSFESNLSVYLDDQDDHRQNAKWQGRPFEDSMYYVVRVDKMKEGKGYGVEWIHHKIYLANPSGPLNSFSISDGFNILYLNKVKSHDNYATRYGLGVVLGHMDVRIDGRDRFYVDGGIGGSYLSGVSAQAAIEKWIWENESHFVNLESKLTVSYVRPPVSLDQSEFANLSNIAAHFTLGLGSKPIQSERPSAKERLHYWAPPVAYHLFAQFFAFE